MAGSSYCFKCGQLTTPLAPPVPAAPTPTAMATTTKTTKRSGGAQREQKKKRVAIQLSSISLIEWTNWLFIACFVCSCAHRVWAGFTPATVAVLLLPPVGTKEMSYTACACIVHQSGDSAGLRSSGGGGGHDL